MSLLAVATMGTPQSAFASAGFMRFAGAWRGDGSVMMDDGSSERIRCRAAYAVRSDGEAMNIDVNCASDSHRVHISTQVVAEGTDFSGSWQETTRQVQGKVTGRISDAGDISAALEALSVAIQLTARTNGRQQAIRLGERLLYWCIVDLRQVGSGTP